jgi:four helix bundle protein
MSNSRIKELKVYKKSVEFVDQIFELSKNFPKDEQYCLTSQIRRSSLSIVLNLREVWEKRRYIAHFVSKLTDCAAENAETDSSLDFAKKRLYISDEEHKKLSQLSEEIAKMIGYMIHNPEKFVLKLS